MNKILYILPFIISITIGAQNLVPNHSFEDTIHCPNGVGDTYALKNWFNPTGASPDYFNACDNTGAGVPSNLYGYLEAQDGDGYIGIVTYTDPSLIPEYREYQEVRLKKTLIGGKTYYWCMWVSAVDSTDLVSNNIGISLVQDSLVNNSIFPLSATSYGKSDNVIADNKSWTKISGFFEATGNEKFLIIGNFHTDANTVYFQIRENTIIGLFAYYYVDNIYIGETPCEDFEIPNIITPNNDGFNDLFKVNLPYEKIKIYNRWGDCIYEGDDYLMPWNGENNIGLKVNSGTYYYVIYTEYKIFKGFVQVMR